MISTQEFIELTKDQDVLQAFGPQHLERLAAMAEEVEFHRDQIIFREGDHHGMFYLILDGGVGLEIITGPSSGDVADAARRRRLGLVVAA